MSDKRPRHATETAEEREERLAWHRREPRHLALGLERIGLISLRYRLISVLILVLLAIAAFFGIERIKVDDSLSQLFRSNTPEFKQYEEVTRRFPSSEFDVLVVIEGKTLLARDSIQKLRELVTDLQLIDGTRGIISLFSARQPPEGGRLPEALFPNQLPEGAEYDKLIAARARQRDHPRQTALGGRRARARSCSRSIRPWSRARACSTPWPRSARRWPERSPAPA